MGAGGGKWYVARPLPNTFKIIGGGGGGRGGRLPLFLRLWVM